MRLPVSLGLPLLAALLLAGCAPTAPTAPTAASDVVLDGVSVLGAWEAIGAPDQPEVDSDLRSGQLTRMLVINPYGRVTLSGEDRRAGTGRTSYEGRLRGRSLTFEGLPGTATLEARTNNRLVLTDPGNNRTVYRRRR
jgi:hypothetical protein